MIKSMLLPVDGSVYTDAQVKCAIKMAKSFKAKIRLLSVVDVRIFEWATVSGAEGFVPVVPSTAYKEESKKMLDSKADAVLEKCVSMVESAKVSYDVEKIHGSPSDIILEKIPLVDLLIMGRRGEFAKWRKKLFGATLDAVIRQWNKPLLTTPQKFKPITNILVAYDGSEKANKALQLAGFFAQNLKSKIAILSISHHQKRRQKFLDEASEYLEPYGLDVELIGVGGQPEKEITRVSGEMKCGLIMMGAFGHSRIREALLGSTTDHVIRNSNTSVLLSK